MQNVQVGQDDNSPDDVRPVVPDDIKPVVVKMTSSEQNFSHLSHVTQAGRPRIKLLSWTPSSQPDFQPFHPASQHCPILNNASTKKAQYLSLSL
eukprot:c16380_g1_i2 orf=715-996(+)